MLKSLELLILLQCRFLLPIEHVFTNPQVLIRLLKNGSAMDVFLFSVHCQNFAEVYWEVERAGYVFSALNYF